MILFIRTFIKNYSDTFFIVSLQRSDNGNTVGSYNLLFNNNNKWEVQESDNGNTMICYLRKANKFNTFRAKIDEDKDLSGTDTQFSFQDWKAYRAEQFIKLDYKEEALPLIYYFNIVLGYNTVERIRDSKYIFSRR